LSPKVLKYIQIAVFLLAVAAYIDVAVNPERKSHGFPDFGAPREYSIMMFSGMAAFCLLMLTGIGMAKGATAARLQRSATAARVIFLALMALFVPWLLQKFFFVQAVDFPIVAGFTLPLPFMLNDLTGSNPVKPLWLIVPGLLLLLPTLLYFSFFYTPYEAYSNGMPIMFVHYHIRNYICFAGSVLLLMGCIRYADKN